MLTEFLIIIFINYIGILLSRILHLPIPGTVVAFLLFFLLLWKKILKLENVEVVSTFLLTNMTLFFLPPAINLIAVEDTLRGQILKIVFLMVITTFLTMGVTGKIVQLLIERKEARDARHHHE